MVETTQTGTTTETFTYQDIIGDCVYKLPCGICRLLEKQCPKSPITCTPVWKTYVTTETDTNTETSVGSVDSNNVKIKVTGDANE